MRFKDREDAGRRLADALKSYRGLKDGVVVALPRGGVVLGKIIADALNLPLDMVVPRKIGAPGNEEYAVGAITETGQTVLNAAECATIDPEYLRRTIEAEKKEAGRRLSVYRAGLGPRRLDGKTVIIVDDGVATGYTMLAAVKSVRAESPSKVVVAVPVCPAEVVGTLKKEADETVVLDTPSIFGAIGSFYDEFGQVDDPTVIELMNKRRP